MTVVKIMTREIINDTMQENVNDANINLNENVNDSESSEFSLFKPKILEALDTVRTKKKRADVNSIYEELCGKQASKIDEKIIASFVSQLIKLNEIKNKKTSHGDSYSEVINKVDKKVTTLLVNMTLEIIMKFIIKLIRLPLLTVPFVDLLTSPQKVAIKSIITIYKQKMKILVK